MSNETISKASGKRFKFPTWSECPWEQTTWVMSEQLSPRPLSAGTNKYVSLQLNSYTSITTFKVITKMTSESGLHKIQLKNCTQTKVCFMLIHLKQYGKPIEIEPWLREVGDCLCFAMVYGITRSPQKTKMDSKHIRCHQQEAYDCDTNGWYFVLTSPTDTISEMYKQWLTHFSYTCSIISSKTAEWLPLLR